LTSPATAIQPGLVSIIIPAYNAAAYVVEAIDSVLAQDYPHKEIVVVNDGSKDNTLEILRGYGDRIRIVDQANAGPPKARNAALAAVQGEFVAFLDADDIWLPGKLSAQVAHFQAHPDVGTVFTTWHVWPADADGVFRIPQVAKAPQVGVGVVPKNSGWMYTRLLMECELLTTTVMMRASLIREIGGFDIELYNGDDYDFWLRASRVAKIDQLDCVGAYYRVVQGSVSRKARPVNDELVVIDKALGRWGLTSPHGESLDAAVMRQHREDLIIQFGYAHLVLGDPRVALGNYLEVLKHRPWRLGLWPAAIKAAVKLASAPRA
jgi:glycosyltransferase involved in cell wall biosynthesis